MRLVRGVVQHYAWGHPSAIPHLLGIEPDGRPWAELWFGTHLGGASRLLDLDDTAGARSADDDTGGLSQPLLAVAGELPFLLKILAAAEPLSLQTHPSETQARLGFARENQQGIPVSNSRRIYRDPFAKPELLCALEPFEALCGFRHETPTVELLNEIGAHASALARMIADQDLDYAVRYLFSGSDEASHLIHGIIEACAHHESVSAQWVTRLAAAYPGDPAVAATLLLNHVILQPGEAIYLDPGNMHAYLRGVGIEVMGSSDNVVRCGLTNKHVDVEELLRTVVVRPLDTPILKPVHKSLTSVGRLWKYETPGTPFTLWLHQIDGAETLQALTRELVLCGVGSTDRLQRGEVCYLAPGEHITLRGKATLFRVTETRR
ncbi:MAG: mannose-6-phosphate isomerase, class I [Ilumatobacteraceae bacterium]